MKSIWSVATSQVTRLTIGSGPNANSKKSLFSHETGIVFNSGLHRLRKLKLIFGLWKRRKGETNDDAHDFSNRDRRSRGTGRGGVHKPNAEEQGADPTWGGQKAPPIRARELGMNAFEYDLVVIGSGPAGQKGAIAAAKARKRVAVIDWPAMIGGVSVHTGTIPSKTMREAIFQLTGFAVKTLSGNGFRNHGEVS